MRKPKLTEPQWRLLREIASGRVRAVRIRSKQAQKLVDEGLVAREYIGMNRYAVSLTDDGRDCATSFKRRKAGEIVRKHCNAGFVGVASLVVIQPEEPPYDNYPCMIGCGDPNCREWLTCLECDAAGNLLGGVACHVSECEMSDP